ncbi:3'-5' exonuclease [Linderina pennispora]|nr:3'-5' exonuclease [Linderina pennispora]
MKSNCPKPVAKIDVDEEELLHDDVVLSMDRVLRFKDTNGDNKKKRNKRKGSANDDEVVDDFVDALLGDNEAAAEKKRAKKAKKAQKKREKEEKERKEKEIQDVKYNDDDVQDLYAWDSDDEEESFVVHDSQPASSAPTAARSGSDNEGEDADEMERRAERQRALSLAMLVADEVEQNGNDDLPRDANDWFDKLEEDANDSRAAKSRNNTKLIKVNGADEEGEEDDGDLPTDVVKARGSDTPASLKPVRPMVSKEKREAIGRYLAVDCEMVGAGFKGCRSMLARVSIVNYYGHVIMDTFVKPQEPVTDYRTWVSGIRKSDLTNGAKFKDVQQQVADLFKDRVVIGHALQNDLRALMLTHPPLMVRDTAKYKGFRKLNNGSAPSLRKLAASVLNINIQEGEHSSVTDAKTTMLLYRKVKDEWEKELHPKRYKVQIKKARTKERFEQLRRERKEQQSR